MKHGTLPPRQGLYDPANEHDACGVGFVANVKGRKSHGIIRQGLQILENLTHRGAVGADPLAGDGAGILMQVPDRFLRGTCPNCKAPDQYGDNCEVCGATYDASELGEPYSILTNTPPVQRESEHLFFRLGEFTGMLRAWIEYIFS